MALNALLIGICTCLDAIALALLRAGGPSGDCGNLVCDGLALGGVSDRREECLRLCRDANPRLAYNGRGWGRAAAGGSGTRSRRRRPRAGSRWRTRPPRAPRRRWRGCNGSVSGACGGRNRGRSAWEGSAQGNCAPWLPLSRLPATIQSFANDRSKALSSIPCCVATAVRQTLRYTAPSCLRGTTRHRTSRVWVPCRGLQQPWFPELGTSRA